MGFLNELAGWAHIANVEARAFIHGGYGSDDEGKEKITNGNSIWPESTRMWVFDKNKADNVCCSSPSAYAAIMAAVRDKRLDHSQISPENINIVQKAINSNKDEDEYDEEETLSGIMAVDVISFVESKGIDLSVRYESLMAIGRFIESTNSPVSPELIAENAGVDVDDAVIYLGILTEYASRNKALNKPFTINPPVQPQQVPVNDPASQSKNSRKNSKAQQPAAAQ